MDDVLMCQLWFDVSFTSFSFTTQFVAPFHSRRKVPIALQPSKRELIKLYQNFNIFFSFYDKRFYNRLTFSLHLAAL